MAPELLAWTPSEALVQPVSATTSEGCEQQLSTPSVTCHLPPTTLQGGIKFRLILEMVHQSVVAFSLSHHLTLRQ